METPPKDGSPERTLVHTGWRTGAIRQCPRVHGMYQCTAETSCTKVVAPTDFRDVNDILRSFFGVDFVACFNCFHMYVTPRITSSSTTSPDSPPACADCGRSISRGAMRECVNIQHPVDSIDYSARMFLNKTNYRKEKKQEEQKRAKERRKWEKRGKDKILTTRSGTVPT